MFKIGDRVKTTSNSSIVGVGVVESITEGGDKLGFPWKDSSNHYSFTDEKTGWLIIAKEEQLELCK